MLALGSLIDVDGVRVGHHQRSARGWRTGTTVVLFPTGSVGGADVRGGAPGTRETDLLRPDALVEEVHAICLSGGSAYGLDAAGGVMRFLEREHQGFRVGSDPSWVVPIVPAAVIFDLGRGSSFSHRPDADFGWRAASRAARRPFAVGAVGAGTGARAGGLQGGVGTASCVTAEGFRVAAIAVVNAVGQCIDPATALPYHAGRLRLARPSADEKRRFRQHVSNLAGLGSSALNTTIGAVVTDANLSKSECQKMAAVAHDGLARAIRPAHSLNDGDTIFGVATRSSPTLLPPVAASLVNSTSRASFVNGILRAAADVFAEACTIAVLAAVSNGGPPAYRDLCPTALRA